VKCTKHLLGALVAMTALSSWDQSSLAATTSPAESTGSIKKWVAGSAMRTSLMKNQTTARQLLTIRQHAGKKPGMPLARAIQQLAAAQPKEKRPVLAWGIAAEIAIVRAHQEKESALLAEYMKEMADIIQTIMESKNESEAAIMRMIYSLFAAASKLESADAKR